MSSLYLVLPEISADEPEWLSAFDRISITPKRQDVVYLLDVVTKALPATLIRITGTGEGVPVVVNLSAKSPLPILPQFLRRSLGDMREKFYAYHAIANPELDNKKRFDPLPVEFVVELLASPVHEFANKDNLGPHEAWPFVASSLAYQGTQGPYWFRQPKTSVNS